MMSLRWGVLHKKTSWTFQGEANGNKWHNCRWLIPPIANSPSLGPPLQAGPGRGLSCRTGILPDCASFSCKGSPAKKKKNAFQWLSYQASISWDTAASKLAGIARGLLMGCQFGCKTLRLDADGSIWHHSKRRISPNRAYGSRTRPGPAVLKNLGPGPPGLARDSDPETPA